MNRSLERTSVFEVTFENDRPVYVQAQAAQTSQIVTLGGRDHSGLIEFRIKGPICSGGERAEAWFSQFEIFKAFDLRFWDERPYAVWVEQSRSDEFYEAVKQKLRDSPCGSRIRRQPVLQQIQTEAPDNVTAPQPALTP